jgi:hypothetical protein
MEIDWKKIHDELGPEYTRGAWDANGRFHVYHSGAHELRAETAGAQWLFRRSVCDPKRLYERFICYDNQCPGEWDKVLLEFPGHYGSTNRDDAADALSYFAPFHADDPRQKDAISYVDLIDRTAKLSEVIDAGKEAAAKLKKVNAAIKAYDEFIAAHGKKFDAAGLEIMFREKL